MAFNKLRIDHLTTLLLTKFSTRNFVPAEFLLLVEAILIVSSTHITKPAKMLKLLPFSLLPAEQHFTAHIIAVEKITKTLQLLFFILVVKIHKIAIITTNLNIFINNFIKY